MKISSLNAGRSMVYLFRFLTIALIVYLICQAIFGAPEMPTTQLASIDEDAEFALLACMVTGSMILYSSIQ